MSQLDKAELLEIERFWRWFAKNAHDLADSYPARENSLAELERRVFNLDSRLSWEVGPGDTAECQLVISPNLDPELVEKAVAVISRAPKIECWAFHVFRPRKFWQGSVVVTGHDGIRYSFNTKNWAFVLLRYPDGYVEVLIAANENLPLSTESPDRWTLGAIVLESLLGEEVVMKAISSWDVLDHMEEQFVRDCRPLSELPAAFGIVD